MGRPKAGYKLNDGTKAVGVTTILGRWKESGGLIWWAYQQGQLYERGEIGGLYESRDTAASAGTLAHDMVEAFIKGKDPAKILERESYPDIVVEQATIAYMAFNKWFRQTNIEVIETEVPLVSNKYGFGGQIDAVMKVDNSVLALGDWKSGKGVYVDALYQLGGYKILWNENFPDMQINGGAHLIRFDKEHGDFHHHHWPDLKEAEEQFLRLWEAYKVDKVIAKRIK